MTQPITDQRNELKLLKARVEAAERELVQLRRRQLPLAELPRQCRLCVTVEDSSYPASGNTFAFIYIEQSFTKSEGTNTKTTKNRSADVQGYGQAADGATIPEDTICLAVEQANGYTILLPLECG